MCYVVACNIHRRFYWSLLIHFPSSKFCSLNFSLTLIALLVRFKFPSLFAFFLINGREEWRIYFVRFVIGRLESILSGAS